MTGSARRCLRLLPVAVALLAAASCGARVTSATSPAGPAQPITPTAYAGPASPHAARAKPPDTMAVLLGLVLTKPSCPTDPVYHACRAHPLGHVQVRAISTASHLVASAWTGADGQFSLHLRPGSYVLVIAAGAGQAQCPREPVSVGSDSVGHASVTCESSGDVQGNT